MRVEAMKRRSRAGRKPANALRRTVRARGVLRESTREVDDALKQQAAVSEVLRITSQFVAAVLVAR
jgi:hypothetical protein